MALYPGDDPQRNFSPEVAPNLYPQSFFPLSLLYYRHPGQNRHPGLAEPTTMGFDAKALLAIRCSHLPEAIAASGFVMAAGSEPPGRAALYTFSTDALAKIAALI